MRLGTTTRVSSHLYFLFNFHHSYWNVVSILDRVAVVHLTKGVFVFFLPFDGAVSSLFSEFSNMYLVDLCLKCP